MIEVTAETICPDPEVHHHQVASGMSIQFQPGHLMSEVPESYRPSHVTPMPKIRSERNIAMRRQTYEQAVRKRVRDMVALLESGPVPGGLFVSSLLARYASELAKIAAEWEGMETMIVQPDEEQPT